MNIQSEYIKYCQLHQESLSQYGKCDVCEGRGLWEGDVIPVEDVVGAMNEEGPGI